MNTLRKIKKKIFWIFMWEDHLKDLIWLIFHNPLKIARKYKELPFTGNTVRYVGTMPEDGIAQLAILINAGCKPEHKVLEIGCGALIAGYPIIQYLKDGNYCGIEPNEWLIDPQLKRASEGLAKARFDNNTEFDGSVFNEKFDYIISHSIISHAAHWQFPQFLENCSKVLNKDGKILFSLYFTDGNWLGWIPYDMTKASKQIKENYRDGKYNGTELDFEEWQYPQNSFFRRETVFNTAKKYGLEGKEDIISTMLITHANPHYKHSWVYLIKP